MPEVKGERTTAGGYAVAIPGAGEPSEDDFRGRVAVLQGLLGPGWTVDPIWWPGWGADVDPIREGLPATYPRISERDRILSEAALACDEQEPEIKFPSLEGMIWALRQRLLHDYAGVAADAMRYWHQRESILDEVQRAIRDTTGGMTTVNVIGHSLGGIIAVDLAVTRRITIPGLVTFGTVISAAHVLDPTRMNVLPFRPGQRVPIPRIGQWTNLWNKFDPVALCVRDVFQLGGGVLPEDVEAELPRGYSPALAHLAYWELTEVRDAVLSTCSRGGAQEPPIVDAPQ